MGTYALEVVATKEGYLEDVGKRLKLAQMEMKASMEVLF